MTQPTNPLGVSVLIRTFNSAKTLERVLSGLKLAEGDEYIAVDSGSTDSTLSIAVAHDAQIVHATGPFNYSKSLNLGFRAARNPWVLVISSHSISVVPDLLEVFRVAARDFPAEVVVGYGPNTLNGQGPYADEKVRYCTRETHQAIESFCGNGNALYRRSAWDEVPFDESIRTGEDQAWLAEVFKRGFNIAFVSAARTMNLTQYSLRYMFLKGYSDCRADVHHQPKSLLDLAMGLGSHTKKFLRGGMPVGSWIRYSAHIFGQFFGSYQRQDNTPGK
jgi:glycosyltransferase involved in cell wall biosynthesis